MAEREEPLSVLPHGWTEAQSEEGDTYYWAPATGETMWERPSGEPSGGGAAPLDVASIIPEVNNEGDQSSPAEGSQLAPAAAPVTAAAAGFGPDAVTRLHAEIARKKAAAELNDEAQAPASTTAAALVDSNKQLQPNDSSKQLQPKSSLVPASSKTLPEIAEGGPRSSMEQASTLITPKMPSSAAQPSPTENRRWSSWLDDAAVVASGKHSMVVPAPHLDLTLAPPPPSNGVLSSNASSSTHAYSQPPLSRVADGTGPPTAVLIADVPTRQGGARGGRFVFVLQAASLLWYRHPTTPLSRIEGEVELEHIKGVEHSEGRYRLLVERPHSYGRIRSELYHLQTSPNADHFFLALSEAVRKKSASRASAPSNGPHAIVLEREQIGNGNYETALVGRALLRSSSGRLGSAWVGLWRLQQVRFIAGDEFTARIEWGPLTAGNALPNYTSALVTGCNASLIRGNRFKKRASGRVLLQGYAPPASSAFEGAQEGCTQLEVDVKTEHNLETLLGFLATSMPVVAPRALATNDNPGAANEEVYLYRSPTGQIFCDVLDYLLPQKSSSKWMRCWVVLVKVVTKSEGVGGFARLGEPAIERTVTYELRFYNRLVDPPKAIWMSGGFEINMRVALRTWAVKRTILLEQTTAAVGTSTQPAKLYRKSTFGGALPRRGGAEEPKGSGLKELVLRFSEDVRHERWMAALSEAKQAGTTAGTGLLHSTASRLFLRGPTDAHTGSAHYNSDGSMDPSQAKNWAKLSQYVAMVAAELGSPEIINSLLKPALDGLADDLRSHIVRKLTDVFLKLTLKDDAMPIMTSLERDARWRRLTEAWARFVLRYVRTSRLADTSAVVLGVILSCDLSKALKPYTQDLNAVDRANRVNDLVAAMERWMAVYDATKGQRLCSDAHQYLAKALLRRNGSLHSRDAESKLGTLEAYFEALRSAGSETALERALSGLSLVAQFERVQFTSIKQLRAFCDPQHWYVHEICNFYEALDEEEDAGILSASAAAGASAFEREQLLVTRLVDECKSNATGRDATASKVVLSLLPFCEELQEFQGLLLVPIVRLKAPKSQARLLFELMRFGVLAHEDAMHEMAMRVVREEEKATLETASEIITLLVEEVVDPGGHGGVSARILQERREMALRVWLEALVKASERAQYGGSGPAGLSIIVEDDREELEAAPAAEIDELLHAIFMTFFKNIAVSRPESSSGGQLVLHGSVQHTEAEPNMAEYRKSELVKKTLQKLHSVRERLSHFCDAFLIPLIAEVGDVASLTAQSELVLQLQGFLWACLSKSTPELFEKVMQALRAKGCDLFGIDDTYTFDLAAIVCDEQRDGIQIDPLWRTLWKHNQPIGTTGVVGRDLIVDLVRTPTFFSSAIELFVVDAPSAGASLARLARRAVEDPALLQRYIEGLFLSSYLPSTKQLPPGQVKIKPTQLRERLHACLTGLLDELSAASDNVARVEGLHRIFEELLLAAKRKDRVSGAALIRGIQGARSNQKLRQATEPLMPAMVRVLFDESRTMRETVAEVRQRTKSDAVASSRRNTERRRTESRLGRSALEAPLTASERAISLVRKRSNSPHALSRGAANGGGDPSSRTSFTLARRVTFGVEEADAPGAVEGGGGGGGGRGAVSKAAARDAAALSAYVDMRLAPELLARLGEPEKHVGLSKAVLDDLLVWTLAFALHDLSGSMLRSLAGLIEAAKIFDFYLAHESTQRAEAFEVLFTDSAGAGAIAVMPSATQEEDSYRISPALKPLLQEDVSLLRRRAFWTEHILALFGVANMEGKFAKIVAVGADFYFRVIQLCIELLHHRGTTDVSEIALETQRVLDGFVNEERAMTFFREIFAQVTQRSRDKRHAGDGVEPPLPPGIAERDGIEDFEGFSLGDLSKVAMNGKGVAERLDKMSDPESHAQAKQAMNNLFEDHLRRANPADWPKLFKEAEQLAYNLVYMFRESVQMAQKKFREALQVNPEGSERSMFDQVLQKALDMYGDKGLVDQKALSRTNFITQPLQLVDVVQRNTRAGGVRQMQLIGEIASEYMKMRIDEGKMPLTPHHTQAIAMLMFSIFFDLRDKPGTEWEHTFRTVILQMKTGEGKSIVIAMLAVFTVLFYENRGLRVHVLENNEGLLDRDFSSFKPFYSRFTKANGKPLTCEPHIHPTADICYCLKKGNNRFFNQQLVDGSLDLEKTVLIVDEVDDLVVNEVPFVKYKKEDVDLTPPFQLAFKKMAPRPIGEGLTRCPTGFDKDVWRTCTTIKKTASRKQEGEDFVMGNGEFLMLERQPDGSSKLPKVPLTDDWLSYKNFERFNTPIKKQTFFNGLCTPYMYNKYKCIFGLTGSVGGAAERVYIYQTYKGVAFEVPQFLMTCSDSGKQDARNLGVALEPDSPAQLQKIAEAVVGHYCDVPVLIITRDAAELRRVYEHLKMVLWDELREQEQEPLIRLDPGNMEMECLQERDPESGELLRDEWPKVIDAATRRHGSGDRSYCHITVTDFFGGRGHDYSCNDTRANLNGGLLVIATSIPDTREWIQWKGRTARQDKPGQYKVILSRDDDAFQDRDVLQRFISLKSDDEKIDYLLSEKDISVGRALDEFSAKQAKGAWLNELTEKYYQGHPRQHDAPWPYPKQAGGDRKLRELLTEHFQNGNEIRKKANEELKLALDGPPDNWRFDADQDFGEGPARTPKSVLFVLDVSYSMDEPSEGAEAILRGEDLAKAQELRRRRSAAGGELGGLTISLMWDNKDDLDLYVVPPCGERIYYDSRTSSCGGLLDVDANYRDKTDTPVENCFWGGESPPQGTYNWFVHNSNHLPGRSVPYVVQVQQHGRITMIHSAVGPDAPTTNQHELKYPSPVTHESRLSTCKECVKGIVEDNCFDDDSVGLLSFATAPEVRTDLELMEVGPNKTHIDAQVDSLKTRGKTAYYKAILAAVQKMHSQPPETPKWVIALTDGADTEGGEAEVETAVELLRRTPNLNLALITMGEDADVAVLTRLAEAAMAPKPGNVRETLGKIMPADDLSAVKEAFDAIAAEMNSTAGASDA